MEKGRLIRQNPSGNSFSHFSRAINVISWNKLQKPRISQNEILHGMTTVKPGSHMPPRHLPHGRRYYLGYFSDMRTEVACNIGHPVLIAGMPAKLTRVTSQIYRQHMTTRLNCVFSFPVNQFEIYFPGVLWEIVFGVITENWLHLIASPSPSFPPYFFSRSRSCNGPRIKGIKLKGKLWFKKDTQTKREKTIQQRKKQLTPE